jgi:hypothetical protein
VENIHWMCTAPLLFYGAVGVSFGISESADKLKYSDL